MITILLLEDDETIAFAIAEYLTPQGFTIRHCDTLAKGYEALSPAISLILLDLNLPDGSGYDFCGAVKQKGDLPIIFLTARDDTEDMVQGLDMGADDYITKPFQLSVLRSRIHAVLRRSATAETTLLCCGEIHLDPESCQVWSENKKIALTAGEYRLLLVLLQNKNRTLTRAMLLERLWDANGEFVNDNTLTVTMKRLREKLGNPSSIRTLRGLGYRMEDTL